MSGLNNTVLLFLGFALMAATARSQGLPDIGEFEVENVRLIILDARGARRGVLKGKRALRKRGGAIEIDSAELSFRRGGESLIVKAARFVYNPGLSTFEAPKGLSVELPGGGTLTVPEGSGTLTHAAGIELVMVAKGVVELRSGGEDDSALDAYITNPTIRIRIEESTAGGTTRLVLRDLQVSGKRGGRIDVHLASLPIPNGSRANQPGTVRAGCFGKVELKIGAPSGALSAAADRIASLSMDRRASMELLGEKRSFLITSDNLAMTGRIATHRRETAPQEEAGEFTLLEDLAIDARGNARVTSENFEAFCSVLRYREFQDRIEIALVRDPIATLYQGSRERGGTKLDLRATGEIIIQAPPPGKQGRGSGAAGAGGAADKLAIEIVGSARVRRLTGEHLDWEIIGRLVRVFSWIHARVSTPELTRNYYSHSFDVFREGYAPLLRMNQPAEGETDGFSPRASVYGARARGSFIAGLADVTVYGPEILAVLHARTDLAGDLRRAMGLQSGSGGGRPDPARTTVRAERRMDLKLRFLSAGAVAGTGSQFSEVLGEYTIDAYGDVELEQHALPRDDRKLVTMTGERVSLGATGERVTLVRVVPAAGSGHQARATLGQDLIWCASFMMQEVGGVAVTRLEGPGRLVLRDQASLAFVREQIQKGPVGLRKADPDAGWLAFEKSLVITSGADQRLLVVRGALVKFVRGDFEPARAGRSAFADLQELEEPTVTTIYEARAGRLYLKSTFFRRAGGGRHAGVNVLRLEQDPYVYSQADRLTVSARDAIEISGADRQDAADSPLTVVVLKDARLDIAEAGAFFDKSKVGAGIFAYDGAWTMRAGDRLELTIRPLDANWDVREGSEGGEGGEEDGATVGSFEPVRKELSRLLNREAKYRASLLPDGGPPIVFTLPDFRVRLLRARAVMAAALGQLAPREPAGASGSIELLQPRNAAKEIDAAVLWVDRAIVEAAKEATVQSARSRVAAIIAVRRARALLGALIDVAGSGGVEATFRARDESRNPKLKLSMRSAIFTFNGLGEPIALQTEGPIRIERASYVLTGSVLRREKDGSLTLDDAAITVPRDTGVTIEGIEKISLKQRETSVPGGGRVRRTLVTRVRGRGLKVRVKLVKSAAAK